MGNILHTVTLSHTLTLTHPPTFYFFIHTPPSPTHHHFVPNISNVTTRYFSPSISPNLHHLSPNIPTTGAPSMPCWPRGLPLQDIKFNATKVQVLHHHPTTLFFLPLSINPCPSPPPLQDIKFNAIKVQVLHHHPCLQIFRSVCISPCPAPPALICITPLSLPHYPYTPSPLPPSSSK